MAVTNRRPPAVITVHKTTLEKATSLLQDLPAKEKEVWSLREAIEAMRETIQAALSKGYSLEEVTVLLNERGIELRPSTLRYYLSNPKKPKEGGAKTIRRKKSSPEAEAIAALDATPPVTPAPVAASPVETPADTNGSSAVAAPSAEAEAPAKKTRRGGGPRGPKAAAKTAPKATKAKAEEPKPQGTRRGGRRKRTDDA